MKELIVPKRYDNKKLNKFLKNNITNFSDNLFYKTLRKKDIKVNGKRVNENINVFENDIILVYVSDDILEKNINLDIIYEDDNIILINKPVQIEVTGKNSLTEVVQKKYCNSSFLPMPCHRLDRNTSGLILFAKNEISLNILLNKFKNHEIEKHYYALVYGIPKIKHQRMEAFLFKDNKKSCVYISDNCKKGYQKIITNYKVLKEYVDNNLQLQINSNEKDIEPSSTFVLTRTKKEEYN